MIQRKYVQNSCIYRYFFLEHIIIYPCCTSTHPRSVDRFLVEVDQPVYSSLANLQTRKLQFLEVKLKDINISTHVCTKKKSTIELVKTVYSKNRKFKF